MAIVCNFQEFFIVPFQKHFNLSVTVEKKAAQISSGYVSVNVDDETVSLNFSYQYSNVRAISQEKLTMFVYCLPKIFFKSFTLQTILSPLDLWTWNFTILVSIALVCLQCNKSFHYQRKILQTLRLIFKQNLEFQNILWTVASLSFLVLLTCLESTRLN